MYSNELYHHGIKGQRWGVRRYQNYDGTRTNAGKQRYNYDSDNRRNQNGGRHVNGKKVAAALAVGAVGAAAAYYAVKNPEQARKIAQSVLSSSKTIGIKALKKTGEVSKKVGKHVVDRLVKAEDAAINAAIASVGVIGISKVNEQYADKEGDTEYDKNRKQIARDASIAAIRAATNANGSSGSGNKGGSVGAEVTSAVGAPSKKGIDKTSARYQALFKDANGNQRPQDTRSTIKSMASAGYDIDQIEEYLNRFAHSAYSKNFTYSDELYHYGIRRKTIYL